MEVSGQLHAPATLLPSKDPSTHCTEDWVGPRIGLETVVKTESLPCPSKESNLDHSAHSLVTTLNVMQPWLQEYEVTCTNHEFPCYIIF